MKYNLLKTGALLVSVLGAACTSNYMDINTNPYEVSKDQMQTDGYAVSAALKALCGTVISTDVNTAQFTDCLLGGTQGGYYADSNSGWATTISNYNPTDDWSRVFMASDKIIPTLYPNFKLLENLTDDPVTLAIARVIKVCAMSRVTDTYGPIPYSAIGEDGKIQVPYDSQQEVYRRMFEELNAAIAVLKENRTGGISAEVDPVYGGSAEKWGRLANSMKLRLAMRIVYADPTTAREMAESAVSLADNGLGVLASNDDNAMLPATAFGKDGNPLMAACKYNQPEGTLTGGDTHAAADIICYMNGYRDPRREKYFVKSEWPGVDYVGLRRGIEIPSLNSVGRKYSGVNFVNGSSTPVQWMNAAEVAFLKAEARAVFGFDMGGEAGDLYNEGIRLSLEQWGVGAEFAAYTADDGRLPQSYTDPAGTNSYSTPLSTLGVAWDNAATKEQMQERILIQKWIANFHLGNEAWADYRRTGFPHLIPATEKGNKSNGKVKSELGARRMPYPMAEYTNNGENVRQALTLLGGPDEMGTRVWWDCNPATMNE